MKISFSNLSNSSKLALCATPMLLAGCNAGADSAGTTTASAAPAATALPTAKLAPTAKPKAGVKVSGNAKPAAKPAVKVSAPKPKYVVRAESIPGAPAELSAALKKVQVPPPPANLQIGAAPRVRLTTSKGAFVVQLNAQAAPLHARSFVYLAKRGFFNNTTFHRFADLTGQGGNIIQGGDPLSKDIKNRPYAGVGGPGYAVPRERNALKHDKLVIAAARSQDPDSAGSQFYVTQAAVPFLDEGDGYTVFGKVIAGADVALKLRQDDQLRRAEVLK